MQAYRGFTEVHHALESRGELKKPLIKKSRRGLLHEKLGVKKGEKIPQAKLAAAKKRAKRTGDTALMKEVTFAQNFRGKKK